MTVFGARASIRTFCSRFSRGLIELSFRETFFEPTNVVEKKNRRKGSNIL
jgi:hypothetical protein